MVVKSKSEKYICNICTEYVGNTTDKIREMIRDEGNGEERGKIRMEGGKIVFS